MANVRATELEDLEGVCMLSEGGANNTAARMDADTIKRRVKDDS